MPKISVTKTDTSKIGTTKIVTTKVDTIKSGQQKPIQSTEKPKVIYQTGAAKVTVLENKELGKSGEVTVKSFEIENVYKKDEQQKINNQFDETELLQLKSAIDKAIKGEHVKLKDGMKTDTTKIK